MFDAGLSGGMRADHIFITHQHCDHCCNLPFHLMNQGKDKIQVYVPEEAAPFVDKFLDATYTMTGNEKDWNSSWSRLELYDMIPVNAPSVLQRVFGKKKYDVEVIKCYHTVPCVGYGLSEKRIKLKEEYAGLAGHELGALRKSGVEINYEVSVPFFCYLGDTSYRVLEDPTIEKYKTIMIECTFLLADDLQQAEETQHIHWTQLHPYILSHPENTFILYHFSQRYKADEILAFFDALAIDNVIPWISA